MHWESGCSKGTHSSPTQNRFQVRNIESNKNSAAMTEHNDREPTVHYGFFVRNLNYKLIHSFLICCSLHCVRYCFFSSFFCCCCCFHLCCSRTLHQETLKGWFSISNENRKMLHFHSHHSVLWWSERERALTRSKDKLCIDINILIQWYNMCTMREQVRATSLAIERSVPTTLCRYQRNIYNNKQYL